MAHQVDPSEVSKSLEKSEEVLNSFAFLSNKVGTPERSHMIAHFFLTDKE